MTMSELAKLAGVSQSTVSLVLNGKANGRIAQKRQKEILDLAKKHNFRANLAAKGLRDKKSYMIGILLPSPSNYFYGDMVSNLQHLLSKTPYAATYAFWEDSEGARRAAQNILSRQVDAIVTCEPRYIPDDLGIPVVSFHAPDKRFDYVGCNPEEVINTCLDYLLKLGHRQISYIGYSTDARSKAFVNIATKRAIISPEIIYPSCDGAEGGVEGLVQILKQAPDSTAILTHDDATALGAMRKAWELGIKIPDDLSIIGFDDIRQARYNTPSLTSIRLSDTKSLASIILDTIFNRFKDKSAPRKTFLIKPQIITRESCCQI